MRTQLVGLRCAKPTYADLRLAYAWPTLGLRQPAICLGQLAQLQDDYSFSIDAAMFEATKPSVQ